MAVTFLFALEKEEKNRDTYGGGKGDRLLVRESLSAMWLWRDVRVSGEWR